MATYGTVLGQGTFLASYTGANPNPGNATNQAASAQLIQIPSNADWMKVYNYTKAGQNGLSSVYFNGTNNAFAGMEYYWQRGMTAGTGIVTYKTNAATTLNTNTIASGGFTLYDPSTQTNGGVNNGSTGVSALTAANPAVATVGSTAGLSAGYVIRFDSLNGALQNVFSGIDFSVGYGTLTSTTFSVDYLNATGSTSSTSGNWRIIPYNPLFYPRRRFITNITAANPCVITLSVDHGFTVGQQVRLNLQGGAAIWGSFASLNNYPSPASANSVAPNTYTITAVDVATGVGHNTITLGGVDTTGFGTFINVWQAIVPPFTQAEVVPVGEDSATSLSSLSQQTPQVNGVQIYNTNNGLLADATVNTGFLGMILGGGGAGLAPTTPMSGPAGTVHFTAGNVIDVQDVMYWVAGKSTYGGL